MGFYSRGAVHRGWGVGGGARAAIGGQGGGATDGNVIRANEGRNGGETSHVELWELDICDVREVLDGS